MEFQKGMDLSFIPELEDAGVQVKDFDRNCYGSAGSRSEIRGKFRTAPYLECAGACQGVRRILQLCAYTGDGKTDPGTWHELYAGFPLF